MNSAKGSKSVDIDEDFDHSAFEDDGDHDIILSKDELELLQRLHRFVPIPALSSNILRVLCDEDLEIGENSPSEPASNANQTDELTKSAIMPRKIITSQDPMTLMAAVSGLPKHSPLTRRLSKARKPHIEINLSAHPNSASVEYKTSSISRYSGSYALADGERTE